MKQEDSLLASVLKMSRHFSGNCKNVEFIYNFGAPGFSVLLDQYPIKEIAGNGSELEKVLNLLCWCSANVLHNGGIKDVDFIPKTSLDILNYAYKRGKKFGVYCRLQSIVFTECCMALGIKSRILHCLPFNPYGFDSHVVSMVYIRELNKWILIDAGNNRYFMDEEGIILSPLEIREKLGNNDLIRCNIEDEAYKQYMTKNLFYFKSLKNNTFGADLQKIQETIYCAPDGFNALEREITCCKYAIQNGPRNSVYGWKRNLREHEKCPRFVNASAIDFFA